MTNTGAGTSGVSTRIWRTRTSYDVNDVGPRTPSIRQRAFRGQPPDQRPVLHSDHTLIVAESAHFSYAEPAQFSSAADMGQHN